MKKISNIMFYIALAIEVVLMIVEKSELGFSYESYIFRGTFILTLLAVILAPNSKKDWMVISFCIILGLVSYRISGRNELLRFSLFVIAARNIDLERTMKILFYGMSAGFLIIALLSVCGILGQVEMVTDYGRDAGVEGRFVFGFGHPNTLCGAVFSLMMLWLWIYGRNARLWQYIVYGIVYFLMYKITVSRTALLIGLFTLAVALVFRYIKDLEGNKLSYIAAAIITPVSCVMFSVWGAAVSYIPRYEFAHKFYGIITRIDELLNNRIHNLYRNNERHGGSIGTWKLFSDRLSEEYFDMGWVRLFYWYGIIPAVIIALLVILFIYICYTKKDAWTLVLILSVSIYTVVEATFVSVYIGRNFMLPILGVYLGDFLARKKNVTNS